MIYSEERRYALPKRYYGWTIVGVSFLIGFSESGVFQNILSIFMKPMVDELGWTRASVTGSIAFGSVCGGALSLLVGPILDKFGPRMVSFWGISLMCLGLFALMFVDRIWQLYLFFGVGRMIAVGLLSLVVSVSIANWFVRFRGRAMGIARIGDRLGATLLPLIVQYLILGLGWRLAWGSIGVILFLISGLPAVFFLRHRPEDMGLLPDGVAPAASTEDRADPEGGKNRNDSSPEDTETVWTRAQAMRTKTFWALALLNSLVPFMQAGINFHTFPFLTDQGLSATTAVWILSTFAVFGMIGSPLWGYLTERIRIQSLLAANLVGNGLIFLLFYWAVLVKGDSEMGVGLIFLLAAVHGIIHGGRNPMLPVIWANFFGRRSLGSIYGMANPFFFTANAIGPIFGGFCFDLFGSYAIAFYVFAAVCFLSAIVPICTGPPKKPGPAPAL
jgi:MFS family permease